MKAQDSPKVSIIIPVYNGSNYLAEAVDSALAQTYENVEIIVINDGSTDDGATDKIAKSYGDKIRYFQKENGGVASTLNFGIQKMTGNYFSWLSHDDLYEKTKIEDQINLIILSPADNTIVVSNARSLYPSGIKKNGLIDKETFKYFDIFLATSADVGMNGCALLIPKDALIESGGFDPALPVTQDYDLWYRLSSRHKYRFVLLEKNLVVYRIHEGQDSIQKQKLCLEAGDDLRNRILSNIDYTRFKEYLMDDKANLQYALSNYSLYKARGFKKTASMILKHILRYYHENDSEAFYKIYCSEVETEIMADSSRKSSRLFILNGKKNKLTDDQRQLIDSEYSGFLNSRWVGFTLKEVAGEVKSPHNMSKIGHITWLLRESVRRDGVYLTGEKMVRKIHSRINR